MSSSGDKSVMVAAQHALAGRAERMRVAERHFVLGTPLDPRRGELEFAMFGMGCFWGAEKKFWEADGVYSTAVGYSAGFTPNPNYEEVCSGRTGHAEVVRVAFDPANVSYESLLRVFWENHDPTQRMRQGNDLGTQYRSGIYYYDAGQHEAATQSAGAYAAVLSAAGYGPVATEIRAATEFYYAEDYHQQYLAKNPGGYCGLGGTGVSCPVGIAR
ncbi:MAG TPA: peptide-methionine (S)-S-oxide reductase MsrA [Candidatus Polarisedimenticolaceae bacterium]|nr:peptide-methionine (S)-S-oxide reductase MsrA [Candidatus Polarisedimenticolaceae bacterium]